jgi:hypothetical protein
MKKGLCKVAEALLRLHVKEKGENREERRKLQVSLPNPANIH